MKRINKILSITTLGLVMVLLVACGKSNYKDGVYEGVYKGEGSSTLSVKLTLKDNKIAECSYESTDKKGNPKDENYGKEAGEANYAIAQRALKGTKTYPAKLVEAGNVDDMEAVSGATVSFKEFKKAVGEALEKASK